MALTHKTDHSVARKVVVIRILTIYDDSQITLTDALETFATLESSSKFSHSTPKLTTDQDGLFVLGSPQARIFCLCLLLSLLGLPERATLGQTNGPTLNELAGDALRRGSRLPFPCFFSALHGASDAERWPNWSAWELDELRTDPSIAPPRVEIRATVKPHAVDGEKRMNGRTKTPSFSRPPTSHFAPTDPAATDVVTLTFALIRLAAESVWVTLAFTIAPRPPSRRLPPERATGSRQESTKAASPGSPGEGPPVSARLPPGGSTPDDVSRCARPPLFGPRELDRAPRLKEGQADAAAAATPTGATGGQLGLSGVGWQATTGHDVIAEMARVMDGVRARGVKRGVFKRQERRHRRGDFYVLKGGLTKGPGQK
ncbi:hypothetical protein B0H14DRAFT_2608913, partial [Mycena olivaceomarginata]